MSPAKASLDLAPWAPYPGIKNKAFGSIFLFKWSRGTGILSGILAAVSTKSSLTIESAELAQLVEPAGPVTGNPPGKHSQEVPVPVGIY